MGWPALAIVLAAVATLAPAVGQVATEDTAPYALESVAAGVRARELGIQTLRGVAVTRILRSSEAIARLRSIVAALKAIETRDGSFSGDEWLSSPRADRSLLATRFVVADGRLRYETTTYVAGLNEWGATGQVDGDGGRQVWKQHPRTTVILDGTYATVYRQLEATGFVAPQTSWVPATRQLPLVGYLLFGDNGGLWGERLAFAANITGVEVEDPLFSLSAGGRVDLPMVLSSTDWRWRVEHGARIAARLVAVSSWFGEDAQVVELTESTDSSVERTRLTIVPSYGYAVTRAEQMVEQGGDRTRWRVLEAGDMTNYSGVWLPRDVELLEWAVEGENVRDAVVYDISFSDLSVNEGVSAEDFFFDRPCGSRWLESGRYTYVGPVDDQALAQFLRRKNTVDQRAASVSDACKWDDE